MDVHQDKDHPTVNVLPVKILIVYIVLWLLLNALFVLVHLCLIRMETVFAHLAMYLINMESVVNVLLIIAINARLHQQQLVLNVMDLPN